MSPELANLLERRLVKAGGYKRKFGVSFWLSQRRDMRMGVLILTNAVGSLLKASRSFRRSALKIFTSSSVKPSRKMSGRVNSSSMAFFSNKTVA